MGAPYSQYNNEAWRAKKFEASPKNWVKMALNEHEDYRFR
jgi:hypothetical protein